MAKITAFSRIQHHGVSDPLSGATIPISNDHTDGSWAITDIYDRELMINTTSGKFQYRAGNSIYTLTPTSGNTGFISLDMSPYSTTERVIDIIPGNSAGNADIVCDPTTLGGISYSYISMNANPGGDGMTIGVISGATYPSAGPAAVTNYQTGFISTQVSDGVNSASLYVNPVRVWMSGSDTFGVVNMAAGGGTITVNNASVSSTSVIFITPQSAIVAADVFYVDNIVNGSFDITNVNGGAGAIDVAWYVIGEL